MRICPVSENRKQYLELLLLGDEQESMIDRYLQRGELYVCMDPDAVAVCVVTDEGCGMRLNQAAAALRDLYDSMNRAAVPQTEENPATVFDRAAERVCRSCALRDLCWQKEYNSTFNAMNDATPFLLERGRALAKDFPQYFSNRCIHMADLLGAINTG